MFVVFEGIDGGGKTTLSNMVAELLRARGLHTEHVREGGKFASAVTQAIRELGRDARNLALTPRAELMLYLAREVQLVEEATRVALARADVVIADRFVYTAEVLAVHGRQLPPAEVTPLVEAATDLRPDLVVLVDVDPQIARARRKVSKLITKEKKPPSRKGLAGTALQLRLRAGYRARATAEPERWLIVDNTDADLVAMAASITDIVTDARSRGTKAAIATASRAVAHVSDVRDRAAARTALLAWIDARSEREPSLAAYFLAGVPGQEFDTRRAALADRAPEVVASGLRWLDDAAAWELRHRLSDRVPAEVASSLVGSAAARPEADVLLLALASRAPREVGSVLRGRNDALAWEVRAQLPGDAVMRSLAGVPGDPGWTMREQWLAERGGLEGLAHDPMSAAIACHSVAGLTDDRAWEVRKTLRPIAPVAALAATYQLTSERAWKWRERSITRAPKIVMASIEGLDDPRAWALRDTVAMQCDEMLDSIVGLDDERAWSLRDRTLALWPASVVKSMGMLAQSDRGAAMIARALAEHPMNLALWRQVTIRAS